MLLSQHDTYDKIKQLIHTRSADHHPNVYLGLTEMQFQWDHYSLYMRQVKTYYYIELIEYQPKWTAKEEDFRVSINDINHFIIMLFDGLYPKRMY